MTSKMSTETLYQAKINQIKMMRHRGYTDNTTMAAKIERTTEEGNIYSLYFRSDEQLVSNESSFNMQIENGTLDLNTYHRYMEGEEQILMINYWLFAGNNVNVAQSEIRTMLTHVHEIDVSFPSLRIGQLNVYCNNSFTPQAKSALETDIGIKIRIYSFQELRPLTHVQLPKYRLLTPEERREFPYISKEKLVKIPRIYEGSWTSKYNGWSAGDIVMIVRKTPHHLSVMSNTVNFRLVIPGDPPTPKLK